MSVEIDEATGLPIVISVFDQALEQIFKLIKDIETNRWDGGVTIFANDGKVDVRGIGTVDTPEKASALVFMAFRTLPPQSQETLAKALGEVMERSERIAKEAPLWFKPTPNLHQ